PPPSPHLLPYTTLFRSGHLELRGQSVAEGRPRAAAVAAVIDAGLRVVGHAPVVAAKRGHQARSRSLRLFAGVGRVRLPRNHEDRSEEHTSELQSPDHLV